MKYRSLTYLLHTADMRQLLMALMTRLLIKEAKEAQQLFSKFNNLIITHIDEIFDTPVLPVPSIEIPEGMEQPLGITPEVILKPVVSSEKWWIDAFSF